MRWDISYVTTEISHAKYEISYEVFNEKILSHWNFHRNFTEISAALQKLFVIKSNLICNFMALHMKFHVKCIFKYFLWISLHAHRSVRLYDTMQTIGPTNIHFQAILLGCKIVIYGNENHRVVRKLFAISFEAPLCAADVISGSSICMILLLHIILWRGSVWYPS